MDPQKFIENITNNQHINLPPVDRSEEFNIEDSDELNIIDSICKFVAVELSV